MPVDFRLPPQIPAMLHLIIAGAAGFAIPVFAQQTVQYSCDTSVTYRFLNGVTQQQQDLIRQATQSGVEFLCRKTGYTIPAFQVAASPNVEELFTIGIGLGYPREAFDGLACAVSPIGALLLNTSNEACWTWTRPDAATRVSKIMAHELFHQVQRRLANVNTAFESIDADRVPTKGPGWLIEGGAELVGYLAVDDLGLRALPVVIDAMFTPALVTSAFPLVGQQPFWNPPSSSLDPYSFAAEAVDQLTSNSPSKLAALMTFWDSIGKGVLWRTSFQSAFGRPIETFYDELNRIVQSAAGMPFGVSWIGTYAPIPNSSLGGGPGVSVPHLFHVSGFDLFSGTVALNSILQLPQGNSGYGSDPLTRNLIIYMNAETVSGAYTLGLRLPDGRSASTFFTHTRTSGVSSPVPEISGLIPASLLQGAPGIKLKVTGRSFVPATTITANGASVSALFKSPGEMEITLSGQHLRGPLSVQASNPPPGGGTSTAIQAPVVDRGLVRIEPDSGTASAAGGSGSITVHTTAPNQFWAVSGETPWLFLNGPRTGSGSATIGYRVAASPERTSRSATLNIGGRTFRLTQASGSPDAPQISPGGVGNAGYPPFQVAADSYMTIVGTGFTDQAITWDQAIGTDGSLPTRLGGVQVRLGERDCYPYFVSSGQINALTPGSLSVGTSLAEIITPRGTALVAVEIVRSSPAFFTYSLDGKSYISALFSNESTLVAPVGAVAGRVSRPARSGDYLSLYANALGPTSVPHPTGQVLTNYFELANASGVRVTFGGIRAPVLFVGMTIAGVFQVNVQVPSSVSDGELPVVIEVDGKSSQSNAFLNFSR